MRNVQIYTTSPGKRIATPALQPQVTSSLRASRGIKVALARRAFKKGGLERKSENLSLNAAIIASRGREFQCYWLSRAVDESCTSVSLAESRGVRFEKVRGAQGRDINFYPAPAALHWRLGVNEKRKKKGRKKGLPSRGEGRVGSERRSGSFTRIRARKSLVYLVLETLFGTE